MRLSHALAMSLALHLATVWLLSSGRIYREGEGSHGGPKPSLTLSVQVRALPVAIVPADNSQAAALAPPPAAERYFAPSEVDRRAEPVDIKPLVIPERAYLERRKGKVKLRAYIDEAGRVHRVVILSAEPAGIFEQTVIDAVTGTVFSPARYDGVPVRTYKDLEINIDPYESIRIP